MARVRSNPTQTASAPELVDPRWLLRAFVLAVLGALLCGYLVLGFLFAQGAWQLVLRPTHDGQVTRPAPNAEEVRFYVDAAGQPQLAGAWVPAASGPLRSYVVLVCRGGEGEVGDQDRQIVSLLEPLGAAVLFFDYRGFGHSSSLRHPSEASLMVDSQEAWRYLITSRRVDDRRVILYGTGIGAVLAARLAGQHPNTAALVLTNADADAFGRILADPRGRIFPVRLLIPDRFNLTDALAKAPQPKLLVSVGPESAARTAAYTQASEPKTVVHLPKGDLQVERKALLRFLDDHHAGS